MKKSLIKKLLTHEIKNFRKIYNLEVKTDKAPNEQSACAKTIQTSYNEVTKRAQKCPFLFSSLLISIPT